MTQTKPQQPPRDEEGEKLVLNSPEEARSPRDFLLWAGVIVLAVLTAFSPALHGKFLWDDDRHVEQNRTLRDAAGLSHIWSDHWAYYFSSEAERASNRPLTPQYYPVTHTSYWIEAQLLNALGRPLTPTLFHVTNMVLHAASAILLWFILRELAVPGAWVAAALWALHPMQAESVAWISERKNVLAGVFFFASILAYLKSGFGFRVSGFGKGEGDSAPSPEPLTLYCVSLGLFILALLSKTVACSMPAVMLLLIWWKRGRVTWHGDVLPLLPFFALGFILAMFTGWIERNYVGATGEAWHLSLVQHVLLAGNAIWFYVAKLVAPIKLTFFYPKWELSPSNPLLWAGVIATIAAPILLFALRRRIGRGPLAAWLIFCGVLVPALGFFPVYPMRYSFVADHFQYLAAPALIALLVTAAAWVLRRLGASAAAYGVAGGVLVVLTVLTVMQSSIYAGQLELWADTSRKNPSNPSVRYNHGLSLFAAAGDKPIDQQGQIASMLDDATKEFDATVKLDPKHDRAWNAWGQVLLERHEANQALAKFDEALKINPLNIDALMGRGQAFVQLKDWESALPAYQRALAAAVEQKGAVAGLRLKAATIYHMIGRIHEERGDGALAATAFREAVRISPGLPQVHYDYGTLLAKQARATTQPTTRSTIGSTTGPTTGPVTPAATHPALVGTTRPATSPAGAVKLAAAAEQFAAAIQAAPDYIDARISLAELMIDVGNLRGAQNQLVAAARINSAYPRLMEVAKRFDAAIKQVEAATRPTTQATTQPSLFGER